MPFPVLHPRPLRLAGAALLPATLAAAAASLEVPALGSDGRPFALEHMSRPLPAGGMGAFAAGWARRMQAAEAALA